MQPATACRGWHVVSIDLGSQGFREDELSGAILSQTSLQQLQSAGAPTSDEERFKFSSYSGDIPLGKVSLNQFWIPGASGNFVEPFCVLFFWPPHLLQLFRRMLKCTFAVNPQKCFVDYKTFHQHVGEKKTTTRVIKTHKTLHNWNGRASPSWWKLKQTTHNSSKLEFI